MELLRRALLVGCTLPALWLFRLATLDPLVSVVSVDPAIQQGQVRPNDTSFVSGQTWDLFLHGIDSLGQGLGPQSSWRLSEDVPETGGAARWVFFKPDEMPQGGLAERLAVGRGTTVISFSRPDGDLRYQVDQRKWTRQEFRPGAGFTGKPVPPSTLLYPFQYIAYGCFLVGVALFALVPSPTKAHGGLSPGELASLAAALLLFAAPLIATGGSVQALTRGLFLTLPCWIFAAIAIHLFAKPGLNAPHPLFERTASEPRPSRLAAGNLPAFLRWGLAMLAVAVGPIAVSVAVSLTLWNR
jgi:hypothetical protein